MKKAKNAKKEKRKKKFSLWRMLSYVGCYIFVAFATAFVVVSVNSSTYSFNPPKLNGGSGDASSSLLGNMVSTLMNMSDLEGSLNIRIEDDENIINIDGTLEVVLYDELSGADLKGDLTLNINGNRLDMSLLYKENMYLVLNGYRLMIDTNSAIEGIVGLLAVSGVDIDLDLGSMMGSLDMSVLDTLGQYITEKTLENAYELIVDYDGLQAVVGLDSQYGIDYITTRNITLGNTKIKFDFDITDTNKGTQFDIPLDCGVNITPALRLAKAFINTTKSESINFGGVLEIFDNELSFNGLYNNDNLMLLTEVLGEKIDLYYKDKMAYIDCGFVQLKGNYESIEEIYNAVYELLPQDIKNSLANIEFFETEELMSSGLGLLDNLKSIDWDIIEHQDYVAITVDTNEIRFYISDDKIEKIILDVLDFGAYVNFEYHDNMVVVPALDFIAVSNMASLIRPIYNLAKSDKLSLDVKLIDEKTNDSFYGTLALDFENIRVDFNTNLFNKDIKVNYIDEYIYIKIDDVHVYTHQSNILGLILHLAQNYAFDLNGIKLFDGSEVLRFENIDDKYFSVSFGNLAFDFEVNDDYVTALNTNISGLDVSAEIDYSSDITFGSIDFEKYEQLDLSKENLEIVYNEVLDYLEGEKYYFDIAFKYEGCEIKGYVEYEEGKLGFDISTTLLDNQLNLVLKDDIVYITYANVKLNCRLDDLAKILGGVLKELGIQIPDMDDDIEIDVDLLNEKIKDILNEVTLSLVDTNLAITYGDYVLNFDLENTRLNSIIFNGYGVFVKLDVVDKARIQIPEGTYVNLHNLYDLVAPLQNLIARKYANMTYCVEYSGIEVSGILKVDARETLKVSGTANIYGKTIYFDYIDKNIYISVDHLKIYTKISDLLTLKEYLNLDEKKDISFDDIVREENNLTVDKTSLEGNKDKYKVGFANYNVDLVVKEGKFVSLGFDDFGILANIQFVDRAPIFDSIDTKKYQYLDLTYDNIESIVDSIESYVNGEEYYFDINAKFGEYEITGWIGYANGEISGYLSATVITKSLEVTLLEDVIYIDFDGLKLQCALDDIDQILSLLEEEFGIALPEKTESGMSISEYLSKIVLTNNNMILNALYGDIKISIDFSDYVVKYVEVVYDKADDNMSEISVRLTPCKSKYASVSGKYLNVASLTNVIKATNKTFSGKTISGEVDLYITFGGEQNILELDYGIRYNEGYEAYISTTFKGVKVDVYLIDNTLYIDFAGMKIYVAISEYKDVINWLNNQFDLGIDLDKIREMSGTSIEDFSFGFLNSWIISNKYIQANIFDNIIIDVYYDTLINKVVFSHGDIKADLYCTSFDEFNLNNVDTTEYSEYTIVTNTIDDIMATVKKKNFDITANAKSYEEGNVDENGNKIATYDVDLNLQISFADILALYGKAIVNDDITVEASWEQVDVNGVLKEYAYVNYDGMKVCADKDSLIEIAAVLLQVLGVDISGLKIFENIGDDFIVETDNFASFLPEIDMGNPLNMLQYIKSLSIEKGVFTLVLKGDLVGQNINDMTAKLYTNNGTIYRLELRDINVGGGETFDLTIDLNRFSGVSIIEDKTGFYDLSSASELVKAFINTSTLRDYHLVGDVKLGLAGIDGLLKVGVDIKVKADEENKTTMAIQLTGFPLVSSITDKNTNHASNILTILGSSYRTRTINIYIRDGYAYLETDDEEFSSWGNLKERYVRATKIPVSYLLNNIEYYMQYLMGFKDNIQKQINTAIQESRNYNGPTDYSDILKGYKYENLTHTLQLNLEEIAHNTQLGIMEVDITTKSNASTNHKDYLYQLGLDMSFLGLITISTDDNNRLELVDIGQNLDMSNITNYINNYSYNTFAEYIKTGNGAYGQSNGNTVTLTFHQNDGYGDLTVSGVTGSYFTLPEPSVKTYIGSDGKEYSFNGWYYYIDTNKTKARLWTESYLPKDSVELFGSWEKQYTLTLYDNQTIHNTYKLFEGDIQGLPSLESYFVDVDGVQEYHEFLGWYDGLRKYDEVEMPKKDLSLYAKWDIYNYYTVNFVNNGEIYESLFKAENSVITISELNNYTMSVDGREVVYKWCGWYIGEDRVIGSYVLDGDVTLEGKWEEYAVHDTKVLKIYDGDTLLYSGNQVSGQEIVMPNNVRIEESTLWYTDKALTLPYGELHIMPNEDLTLYICNQFNLTIEYSQFRNGRRNIVSETHKVYQNADISSYIPAQVSGSYDDGTETKCTYYTFTGWNDARRIMPNGDITISANWEIDVKYYFTINFDVSKSPDSRSFSTTPTAPESIRVLDGTSITLSGDQYHLTCQTSQWLVIYTKKYDYVSDGWSYTQSSSTNGGGTYSFDIDSQYAENGVITLYPCWKSK